MTAAINNRPQLEVKNKIDRRLSVAPMMEYTDRHCRYLLRLISQYTLLYTEMVTSGAVLHGDRKYLLDFDPCEHPLALQLGGSDPKELSEAAKIAEQWGYDEVNLNVGCPSDKVQNGAIGACLMAHPQIVADCISAMQKSVSIPVTVKCRIGIDDQDSYEALNLFVNTVANAGCQSFIVHARKAILKGLSPKQNREIPPLNYGRVYRLKQDYPALEIIINGGITSIEQSQAHLAEVDGVMIGREAYHNPYVLALADQRIFGQSGCAPSRQRILEQFIEYSKVEISKGTALKHMAKHSFGLFHGQPGARHYRRFLSENIHQEHADIRVFEQALALVPAI